MIFFANNCSGAQAYNVLKQQIQVPIAWCYVNPGCFLDIARGFGQIDFHDVVFELIVNPVHPNRQCVKAVVCGKYELLFVHYMTQDKKRPNILEYAKDCWFRRLERMESELKNNMQQPLFFACASNMFSKKYVYELHLNFTLDDIRQMKQIENMYLCTTNLKCDKDFIDCFGVPERTVVVNLPQNYSDRGDTWKHFGTAIAKNIETMRPPPTMNQYVK